MTSQQEAIVKLFKHGSLHIQMHVVDDLMWLLSSCHPVTTLNGSFKTGGNVQNHPDRAFLRTSQLSPSPNGPQATSPPPQEQA